ncbi:methyl-accepting chemotaxis protein [Inhella sp.]|uniref:methyl-accepting chemotaxis protein n=1 Tax=Inhella sp. TaxID=1921806 RepID=UPI0035B232BE
MAWGLRQRLLGAFGVLALVTALGGLAVWLNIHRVDEQLMASRDRFLPQAERIADVKAGVIKASLEARHAMLAPTEAGREAALARLHGLRTQTDAALADFQQHLSTAQGRALYAELEQRKQRFWREAEALLPLIRAGEPALAFARLESDVVPARDHFIEAVAAQRAWQAELLANSTAQALALGQRSERMLLAISLVGLLAGCGFAWWLSRELLGQLGGEPAQAVAAVARVASGDLSQAPPAAGAQAAHSVLGAIGRMQHSLHELLLSIHSGVNHVATASSQIASGNSELSGRTEQQAAALQQAAASLQQLNEAVQQHIQAVEASRGEAEQVAQLAHDGGARMGQAVADMERIRGSSQRMVDIIGTIDGIAFQTNILALNAAVEAARAGDAGRGFAVVASEVRTLAQRVAEASQEVRQLIQSSVDDVGAAHQRMARAGEQVQAIVQGIERLREHMAHINQAIHQQAQGLQQVSGAVGAIDEATQRNAALVEQSAAASASLHQQAMQLERAARRFKLPARGASA